MKNAHRLSIVIPFLLSIIVSCAPETKKQDCSKSYDVVGHDTVNMTDCKGKQGKWIPTSFNKLQDTVCYSNDSIVPCVN